MTAPAKSRRSWRYYTVRVFATVFVVAGAIAVRRLVTEIPDAGIMIRGIVDLLTLVAAIWTTSTIWGYEWPRRNDAD